TEQAMKKIKETSTETVTFFGRKKGNQVKPYGEIFGVKVHDHKAFAEACEIVKEKEKVGMARGLAWNVFRTLGKDAKFVELPPGCEDFDKKEDLDRFLAVHK